MIVVAIYGILAAKPYSTFYFDRRIDRLGNGSIKSVLFGIIKG